MKISMVRLPIIAFFSCELIYPILSLLTTTEIAGVVCNIIVITFLIGAMFTNAKNVKFIPWMIVVLSVGAFIVTGLIYPEYQDVLYTSENSWGTVFAPRGGITLMLLLTLVNDPEDIFDSLKISAFPVWIAYTIRTISGVGLSESTGTNHAYGYAFLFVSIIYLICFFRERKPWQIAISIIALLQLIMYASRTAFLSYVVFLALYALFCNDGKMPRKKKVTLVILGVIIAFVVTSDAFLMMFSYVTKGLGISSKIIDAIISGDNALDGGRERAYETALSLLKKNPLGLGIYWDRYYCSEVHYVHSFIYEVLLDFGWVFGGLILIWLVKSIVTILRSDKKSWKVLLIIFFSLSMIRLTLSYSFWLDKNFWGMIAVIIGYRYSTRKKSLNKSED